MKNGKIAKAIKSYSKIYNTTFYNGIVEVWDKNRFCYKVRLEIDYLTEQDALENAQWQADNFSN